MTFIVKARPGSPSAVDILASLVLLRKATITSEGRKETQPLAGALFLLL